MVSGPRFDQCSHFSNTIEEGTPTIEITRHTSDATVIADIVEIGGGFYNLPNGELKGVRPLTWYDVYRPTIVDVRIVARGEAEPGPAKLRLPGGEIGCDTYFNDRVQAVDHEGPYVLFLSEEPDLQGNNLDELTVVRAWPINEEGLVVTPYDGDVSIDELVRRASAN